MKQCPTCQAAYTDETQNFCLNDGTQLVKTQVYNPVIQDGKTVEGRAHNDRRFSGARIGLLFVGAIVVLCGLPLGFFGVIGYLQAPENSLIEIGSAGGGKNSNAKPSLSPAINSPNPETPSQTSTGQTTASADWKIQRTLTGHTDSVHDVAFSPDGNLVASASWDSKVSVWDAETGARLQTFQHGYHPHKVLFSSDNNFLYSSGGNGLIKMWNLQSGTGKTLFDAKADFLQLALSADGSLLACDCSQKGVRVLDAKTGAVKFSADRGDYIWAMALSPDGKFLAAGGGRKKNLPVTIWEVETSAVKKTIPANQTLEADALAFTPDGNQLVVGSGDSLIRFFDINTGEIKKEFTGRGGQVQQIIFSPDNRFVYAVIGGFAQIYDLQEDKWLGELARSVYGLDISADGKMLVTGDSDDNTVKIWK